MAESIRSNFVGKGTAVQICTGRQIFDKEVLDFRSTEEGVLLNYRSQGITKEVQTSFAVIDNGANSYLARKLGIGFYGIFVAFITAIS